MFPFRGERQSWKRSPWGERGRRGNQDGAYGGPRRVQLESRSLWASSVCLPDVPPSSVCPGVLRRPARACVPGGPHNSCPDRVAPVDRAGSGPRRRRSLFHMPMPCRRPRRRWAGSNCGPTYPAVSNRRSTRPAVDRAGAGPSTAGSGSNCGPTYPAVSNRRSTRPAVDRTGAGRRQPGPNGLPCPGHAEMTHGPARCPWAAPCRAARRAIGFMPGGITLVTLVSDNSTGQSVCVTTSVTLVPYELTRVAARTARPDVRRPYGAPLSRMARSGSP